MQHNKDKHICKIRYKNWKVFICTNYVSSFGPLIGNDSIHAQPGNIIDHALIFYTSFSRNHDNTYSRTIIEYILYMLYSYMAELFGK